YQLLLKEHANENIATSPLALEVALNMIYMGSKDKTAAELKEVLKVTENTKIVSGKYDAFFQVLKTRETTSALDIANSIYVSDKIHIVPEYSKAIEESFRAQAVPISVASPDKAASVVNAWVKKKTHDRIPNAVTAKDIDPSLKILLLNAFAFKGEWVFKFPSFKTRVEKFHSSSGKAQSIKMMSQYGFYKAGELPALDAKVLQLRYHKSSLSMFVFLPNKADGLTKLEEKIGEASYQNLTSRQVHIKLPKFKIEFKSELNGILKKLGIVEVFGAAANLEDLVQEKSTEISKVIQKGVVEISEQGSG
ncbi:hypothetical protein KR200_007313, partial [Drosophila serrata]